MFRHPGATAESVIKDCKTANYLTDFHIDREILYKLWYNSYQRVLTNLSGNKDENMIFVHYEQLLSKEILPKLSEKLEVDIDSTFVSPELNRSPSTISVPQCTIELYETLCSLSQITH